MKKAKYTGDSVTYNSLKNRRYQSCEKLVELFRFEWIQLYLPNYCCFFNALYCFCTFLKASFNICAFLFFCIPIHKNQFTYNPIFKKQKPKENLAI